MFKEGDWVVIDIPSTRLGNVSPPVRPKRFGKIIMVDSRNAFAYTVEVKDGFGTHWVGALEVELKPIKKNSKLWKEIISREI